MIFELVSFSLLLWAAQFSPGPDMVLLMKNALGQGRRAALGTVVGIACGLGIWCAVILSGLAAVLRRSPEWFTGLRVAGGLYLGWLGLRLLHSLHQPGQASPDRRVGGGLGFRGGLAQGLTTNLLNAKAALFLIGSLAAFHPPGSPPWLKWALGGIVLGQAIIGWSAFVCLLGWPPIQTWFLRHQRPWNTVFGILLLAAGAAAIAGAGGR